MIWKALQFSNQYEKYKKNHASLYYRRNFFYLINQFHLVLLL